MPKEEEDKPVRLAQKMYIVADLICIIFSGENKEVITFIKVFKSTFQKQGDLSANRIHQFLQAYALNKNFQQSGFLLMYINPNIWNQGFKFHVPKEDHEVTLETFEIKHGPWNILREPNFTETAAQGTGTEGFLRMIKEPVKFTAHFKPDPFMEAVQRNVATLARVLTLERVSLYTIRDLWGAGFEVAYFNGSKFEKIDKIAYIINHSKFNERGDIGLPIPMLTMYYRYINDILYITAIEVFKYAIAEDETHTIFTSSFGEYKATIFEVEGLDVEDINHLPYPADFSFAADRVSMGYSLELPDKSPFNPAFFNMGAAVTVTFEQGKGFEIRVYKEVAEEIRKMAMDEYPRLSK